MQLRETKKRVQLLRSEYDPNKRRTHARFVASIDSETLAMTDEVKAKLTSGEVAEVEGKLDEIRQRRRHTQRETLLERSPQLIDGIAESVDDDTTAQMLTSESAEAILAAVDRLQHSLRARGYKKANTVWRSRKESQRQRSAAGTNEQQADAFADG